MVMFFIREKIDLNYTIIVKELKQELKLNRVELPQPPLKTNLERTIYDTCLMPRTKSSVDKYIPNPTIEKSVKNADKLATYDRETYSIKKELAKNALELPPYDPEESRTLMDKWMCSSSKKEERNAIIRLWKSWMNKHPNEDIDWIPDYVREADGLSPTASGKEGEDLPGFSSGEFPSSIHPVEEEEAPAEAPWSLKELLEEDSFTISSIDQMEEEESVGLLPNLSEVVGEMSAPTSSRVNREMSAPITSRNIGEMSALNIPTGVWRIALAGGRRPNIEVRKSIIAEVLKPQCVMPSRGTKTWRYLDVLIAMERNRYSVNLCRSRTPEARRENRRMMDLLKDFCARTGCGVCRNRMHANSMLLELLN